MKQKGVAVQRKGIHFYRRLLKDALHFLRVHFRYLHLVCCSKHRINHILHSQPQFLEMREGVEAVSVGTTLRLKLKFSRSRIFDILCLLYRFKLFPNYIFFFLWFFNSVLCFWGKHSIYISWNLL